ncbi:hypothetical protein F4859DRAFT_510909 [Xylaria cf. heliscus]|nr:hypothetical protein F4859DRAFT_510909 [Xylaria cf. heliscus]
MVKTGSLPSSRKNGTGSELFIGSQQRFAELDAAGWESPWKDKENLYDNDMLRENKAEGDGGELHWLQVRSGSGSGPGG